MNAKAITGALIAAIAGFTLALPGIALADRDDRGHRQAQSQHDGHNHRQRARESTQDRRHAKRDAYSGHRERDHHKFSKREHRRHGYYRDDDDDEKLLIGLVVGGILGYALNEGSHNGADDYDTYYDDSVYRGNTSTVNTSGHGTCLQEREYQTTVVVGGREVDAYGTACLQPDGSWKRSPPQLATY